MARQLVAQRSHAMQEHVAALVRERRQLHHVRADGREDLIAVCSGKASVALAGSLRSTYENSDSDVASDPRMLAPMDVETERNQIRLPLSAAEKFNGLLSCSLSRVRACVIAPTTGPVSHRGGFVLGLLFPAPLATAENLFSHRMPAISSGTAKCGQDRDWLQFDCALPYGPVEFRRTLDILKAHGWSLRCRSVRASASRANGI